MNGTVIGPQMIEPDWLHSVESSIRPGQRIHLDIRNPNPECPMNCNIVRPSYASALKHHVEYAEAVKFLFVFGPLLRISTVDRIHTVDGQQLCYC